MEIFSPGPVPYPGCYQCPRCKSREVYDSEKTIGVSAMTIDVPGPVNSTIVNVDKIDAKRCRYCNTVAPWVMHPKAREEFEARKKRNRIRRLKTGGIVVAAIITIIAVGQISSRINHAVSTNRAANAAKNIEQTINQVHTQWQSASDKCGLNYQVAKELNPEYGVDGSQTVSIYIADIDPKSFPNYWSSKQGAALACFTKKVTHVNLPTYFSYSSSQISKLAPNDTVELYDQHYTDSVVKGVVGKDKHLQGYLVFFGKDDFVDHDHFAFNLRWVYKKQLS